MEASGIPAGLQRTGAAHSPPRPLEAQSHRYGEKLIKGILGACAFVSAITTVATNGAIPVVLSRRLLQIYDKTIAPTWGVPGLPRGFDPVGLELPLRVGLSIVPGRSEAHQVEVRVRLVARPGAPQSELRVGHVSASRQVRFLATSPAVSPMAVFKPMRHSSSLPPARSA